MEEADITAVRECLQSGAGFKSDDRPPLCREVQFDEITSFVMDCLDRGKGGGVYLSGVPGTGKSLTADAVLRSVCNSQSTLDSCPAVLTINCLALASARNVYGYILQGYHDFYSNPAREPMHPCKKNLEDNQYLRLPWTQAKKEFEALVLKLSGRKSSRKRQRHSHASRAKPGMAVVLLDEMDCLISKDESLFQGLYECAAYSKSLVLLGAANSLDLTERVMTKLTDQGFKPTLVEFPAYRAAEACQVLKQRLSGLSIKPIDDGAIELCAKKVAAHSGDMRHVLETCASAFSKALSADNDLEKRTGPMILGAREILHVLHSMQDARSSSNAHGLVRGLPKLQQILLFAIWQQAEEANRLQEMTQNEKSPQSAARILGKRKKMKGVTRQDMQDPLRLSNIHSKFTTICDHIQVCGSSLTEVQQMTACLDDAALIEVNQKKVTRDTRVSLRINHEDLESTFMDHILFRSMLEPTSTDMDKGKESQL